MVKSAGPHQTSETTRRLQMKENDTRTWQITDNFGTKSRSQEAGSYKRMVTFIVRVFLSVNCGEAFRRLSNNST